MTVQPFAGSRRYTRRHRGLRPFGIPTLHHALRMASYVHEKAFDSNFSGFYRGYTHHNSIEMEDIDIAMSLAGLYAAGQVDGKDDHDAVGILEVAIEYLHWPARQFLEELRPGWGATPQATPIPDYNPSDDFLYFRIGESGDQGVIDRFDDIISNRAASCVRWVIGMTDFMSIVEAMIAAPYLARQHLLINLTASEKEDIEFALEAIGPQPKSVGLAAMRRIIRRQTGNSSLINENTNE